MDLVLVLVLDARVFTTAREDEDWTAHHERSYEPVGRPNTTFGGRSPTPPTWDTADPKRGFVTGIRADADEPGVWTELEPTHSRAALLHAQWVSGPYWAEHGLKPPAMPEKFRSRVNQLRRTGEVPREQTWRTTRDGITELPYPIDGVHAPGVLNHQAYPALAPTAVTPAARSTGQPRP